MNRTITGFEIQAKGHRREEHPTGFKIIHLQIAIVSPDVTGEDMSKVIHLAEDTYCPVWAMIKGNTMVETAYTINPLTRSENYHIAGVE